MWNGREQKLTWDWFSIDNYDDEAQRRIDSYSSLIKQVDKVYEAMPYEAKDAF